MEDGRAGSALNLTASFFSVSTFVFAFSKEKDKGKSKSGDEKGSCDNANDQAGFFLLPRL